MTVRLLLAALALGGCSWVYEQQYEDRRAELEERRLEFLPGDSKTEFITASQNRLFWVDVLKPFDVPMLHSFDPATGAKIDYTWSADLVIDDDFRFSGALVVDCSFGSVYEAYDASDPERIVATTMKGSSECAVDGDRVYFLVGRELLAWTPGAGEPSLAVDLDQAGVAPGSIDGFGIDGTTMLLAEGGDLWHVDLTARRATWLMNEQAASGTVVFDEAGVFYGSGSGDVLYTQLSDLSTYDLATAIEDGGYELSFKHADVHHLAGSYPAELALYGRNVIYRGRNGIFAFGLDSRKVIDLLLDTSSDDFGATPVYRRPSITSDGTLFVVDDNGYSANDNPVYKVDIRDRLF